MKVGRVFLLLTMTIPVMTLFPRSSAVGDKGSRDAERLESSGVVVRDLLEGSQGISQKLLEKAD
jgi:hypothetical protein